ncbi:uncharacterized protein LOC110849757 [Folsomia candida]|uniref:Uncharacterized protein n=1 Tax=Folsomia candida TaxID=158441 RepID=A0A226E980_FOLCA|nr:uncharacterized protein LOC110849757 [Folsomia candida]OXA54093.1 hypothetical protein Fcan01_10356 [Folsomia candida]
MPPKKKRGRINPPIPLNPPSPTPPGSSGVVSVLPTIYIASNLFDDDDEEEEDWVLPTITNVFTASASSPLPPPETIEIPDNEDLPADTTSTDTTTTTTEILDPEKSLKLSSPVPSPSPPPPPRPPSPFVPEPTSGLCDLCGGLFLGEEEDASGETFSDHVCGSGLCSLCGYLYLDRDDFKRHEGECGIFKEDPPPPVLTPIKNQAANSAEVEGTPPNITDVNYAATKPGTELSSKSEEKLPSNSQEEKSKSEENPSPKSTLNPKFLKIRNPDSKTVKDPEWEVPNSDSGSSEAEDDNDADVVFTIRKKDTAVDKDWSVRPRRAAAQRKSYKF